MKFAPRGVNSWISRTRRDLRGRAFLEASDAF